MEVEVIGKLRYLNIVSFKVYYWFVEEKFFIYDYIFNISLYDLLYGMVILFLI